MRTESLIAIVGLAACAHAASAGDFATSVVDYTPAPGQFVNDDAFNDPTAALGAPTGLGTVDGSLEGVVNLGGFGGSITLAFDRTVRDDPRNPLGLDAIVFGNAFWACEAGCASTDPTRRFAEAATIEVCRDSNGNGVPDDGWFVVRAPQMPGAPEETRRSQDWDDDPVSGTPPLNAAWYPASAPPDGFTTTALDLTADLSPAPGIFVVNDDGEATGGEAHYALADLSPTLRPGDMSGAHGDPGEDSLADAEDEPGIDPAAYYTLPDDPMTVGVDERAPGGDAFDIAWAVDPATGEPAGLDGFDFVRLTTCVDAVLGPLGEVSPEIDAVADVRALGDFDGDDEVGVTDLGTLLTAWGTSRARVDLDGSGTVGSGDLAVLIANWGAR